jgi:hypothetical protein
MGMQSALILEYRSSGFNNGQVYIHTGRDDVLVYYGPAAKTIYEALKQFGQERHEGSGNWYEQQTSSGLQWRERLSM